MIGRRYNRVKKHPHDNLKQNAPKGKTCTSVPTADSLAKQHNVSPRTVKNAGQFADAVEKIKQVDPDIERKVISGGGAIPLPLIFTLQPCDKSAMDIPIIDPEFQALIPPSTEAERRQLEDNLKADGCRDPLTTWQNIILDGHTRFEICSRLGIAYRTLPIELPDRLAAIIWIRKNQVGRRNLSDDQRAIIAAELAGDLSEKARQARAIIAGTAGGRGRAKPNSLPTTVIGKLSNEHTRENESRHQTAKAAKVSERKVQAAMALRKQAPALAGRVRAGSISLADAKTLAGLPEAVQRTIMEAVEAGGARNIKSAVNAQRKSVAVESAKSAVLPQGKFSVIVADPPWRYDKRAEDITHRGACPYPSMSSEDIAAMPVEGIAADNCVLWLWTTNAFLADANVVAESWGFEVKTVLTWAKDRMGVGDWLRGQTEHCLMAVKGKPVVNLTNQTTLLHGKVREHSRKPDEFYAMVETLCPGAKCELFSRQSREGWAEFGAEVGKFSRAA